MKKQNKKATVSQASTKTKVHTPQSENINKKNLNKE